MRTYEQLSLDERYQIQTRLRQGQPVIQVAKAIGRHRSTVYREVARNSDLTCTTPYLAPRASKIANDRRVRKGEQQRKIQGDLQVLVEQKLRLSWSPEQICGRLWLEQRVKLTAETIYQHVLRDSARLGFYRYCLRFRGYKYTRFRKSKVGTRTRARKKWLDQRPDGANLRTELGHWERDCVLGTRGKSALLTMVDRKSRFTLVDLVSKLDADTVSAATEKLLRPHAAVTKSITNDNGIEFQRDESLQDKLGVPIYFCDPHSPWRRGSIENLNGLVRQYCPKRTNFDDVPSWVPEAVEETLNFRPRKVLGFETPHEVFHKERICLTKDKLMHFGLAFSVISSPSSLFSNDSTSIIQPSSFPSSGLS